MTQTDLFAGVRLAPKPLPEAEGPATPRTDEQPAGCEAPPVHDLSVHDWPNPGRVPDDPEGIARWVSIIAHRREWKHHLDAIERDLRQGWGKTLEQRRAEQAQLGADNHFGLFQRQNDPANIQFGTVEDRIEWAAAGAIQALRGEWYRGRVTAMTFHDPDAERDLRAETAARMESRGYFAARSWIERADHPLAVRLREQLARWEVGEIIAGRMPSLNRGSGGTRETHPSSWDHRREVRVTREWTDGAYLNHVTWQCLRSHVGARDRERVLRELLPKMQPAERQEAIRRWLRAEVGSMHNFTVHHLPGWRYGTATATGRRWRLRPAVRFRIDRQHAQGKHPDEWGKLVKPHVARDDRPWQEREMYRWTEDQLVQLVAGTMGLSLSDQGTLL